MKYKVSFEIDLKRNTYSGKFIVVEGIDGSGKTTQVDNLVEALKKQGKKVFLTKEPTDEFTGKLIRKILAGEMKIAPVGFQYLFAADRAVHQIEIENYLKKGYFVICDRYFWSALVYGMMDRNIDFDVRKKSNYLLVSFSILSFYNQFMAPDKTFLLKISVREAMKRIVRKNMYQIYETEEKLKKLKKGYDWLVKKFPKEFKIIDGERSVEEVTEEIVSRISNF